jgi:YidC/Oxa1 family membrane protein insertase
MSNILYTVTITPLETIIELFFVLVHKIFKNPGFSIAGVSILVTVLCLPLYIIAERWQQNERNISAKLRPKLRKIKETFKGDEKYMILSVFYRQNHYHPIYALRNSFSLIIQIPFFIAAYHFLSNLEQLKGAGAFGFIKDLHAPDNLILLNGIVINFLPILMTIINIAAGAVYTKGLETKDKVQIYLTALVFLVILYNSPSGLVIYWTLNQVLSLLKNIFYRIKNPIKVIYFAVVFFTLVFICYILFINNRDFAKRLLLTGVCILIMLSPLFLKIIRCFYNTILFNIEKYNKKRNHIFLLICLCLTLLSGFAIPSAVISSAPEEFSFIETYNSPLNYIFYSLFLNSGLFLLWPVCIFYLFGEKTKNLLTGFFGFILILALINTFIFQGNYGVVSSTFTFNTTGVLKTTLFENIINAASLLAGMVFLVIIFRKKLFSLLINLFAVTVFSLFIFSIYNTFLIQKTYLKIAETRQSPDYNVETATPVFMLSKTNKNIIIFMADNAVGAYIPEIFKANPGLNSIYDGFVHYANTLSFSNHTLTGTPPIYGGFEYTPLKMNERNSVPMKDKHNEALLTTPVLLSNSGFDVTVTDPPFANYEAIPDVSIYNKYEHITAFNTINHYSRLWYSTHDFGSEEIISALIKRNSLFFSLLKMSPPIFRALIYDKNKYWNTRYNGGRDVTSFIDSYAVLDFLPDLTEYTYGPSSALLIDNDMTHEPTWLQYPDYVPVKNVSNRGEGFFNSNWFYHINSAFYLRFSRWLEALKENNVYDNTRIIIVSDHGASVDSKLFKDDFPFPGERREKYNPVLLVKDFNSRGSLKTDMALMTTADIPVLALKGINNNPTNPFTNKPITMDYKSNGVIITTNHEPNVADHGKYTFKIKNNQWIQVKDNIFDANNWRPTKP